MRDVEAAPDGFASMVASAVTPATIPVKVLTSKVSIPLEKVPCDEIKAEIVWSKTFVRLNSECPLRTVDVNADGVTDIIVGYGLGNG